MYVKSATIALSLMALNGASAFAPGKFSIVEFSISTGYQVCRTICMN